MIDSVVNASSGVNMGFIAVGRSLREVEIRENSLGEMVAIGWLATLVAVFAAIWIVSIFTNL